MKRWAGELLNRRDVLILDTETTGLDGTAELVELAIIDTTGKVLLDELIKPTVSIPLDASRIHGITDSVLRKAGAKTWLFHHNTFRNTVLAANMLLVYNLEYDERIIRQTYGKYDLPNPLRSIRSIRSECVMLKYAEYRGIPGRYGDYRWHKLVDAYGHECGGTTQEHRALSDCRMVLGVMQAVASG